MPEKKEAWMRQAICRSCNELFDVPPGIVDKKRPQDHYLHRYRENGEACGGPIVKKTVSKKVAARMPAPPTPQDAVVPTPTSTPPPQDAVVPQVKTTVPTRQVPPKALPVEKEESKLWGCLGLLLFPALILGYAIIQPLIDYALGWLVLIGSIGFAVVGLCMLVVKIGQWGLSDVNEKNK